MNTDNPKVLSLDFGGTKLSAAVINVKSGEICSLVKHATPSQGGAKTSIQKMFEIAKQALIQCNLTSPSRVGISFGGPVALDRKTVLMSNHVAHWEGIPLPQMASDVFICPAAMDNDANAAALGSWWFDAKREPDYMIYIQISTGIGAGLILNRHLYRGRSLAGELGHITMLHNGPQCMCGKQGCLESLSAGWAIARVAREVLTLVTPESPLYRICGGDEEKIDARMLIQAANDGDTAAKTAVTYAFTMLGIAIANVISLFDPQVVMLGGGVARAEAEMRAVLEPVIERELHPLFKDRCTLRFSQLEGKETLLGAALLEE